MEYRKLGNCDLRVSEIALGSWLTYGGGVPRAQAEACIARAYTSPATATGRSSPASPLAPRGTR